MKEGQADDGLQGSARGLDGNGLETKDSFGSGRVDGKFEYKPKEEALGTERFFICR